MPDRGKGQRQGRGWWKGKCECRPGYTVTITTNDGEENKTLCQAPTVVLAKFLNNKTSGYKYKNKQAQEIEDEGSTNRVVETIPNQNKYTKLANVRNNSKVTKLSTLRSEDGIKLSPSRSDRRNSRYKTSWEARELSRMKELSEKNRKSQEGNEKGETGERVESKEESHGERIDEGNTERVKTLDETAMRDNKEMSDNDQDNKNNKGDEGQETKVGDNSNASQAKDVAKETNDIIKKIKVINSSNRHSTSHSRDLGGTGRTNSKELNVEYLSSNEQRLLESNENRNYRRGRKNSSPSKNINNEDDEVYRNLKTIQDDINQYIRQQKTQDEQEDRLKNHKLVDEDIAQNEEITQNEDITQNEEVTKNENVKEGESGNARGDVQYDGKLSQSGTEEFDTNVSLEVIKEANENLRKSNKESLKRNEDSVKRNEDRRTNHRDEDFEDGNSTETLIMLEDKKGRIKDLSEYDHRKHIKEYVKPIIIFE